MISSGRCAERESRLDDGNRTKILIFFHFFFFFREWKIWFIRQRRRPTGATYSWLYLSFFFFLFLFRFFYDCYVSRRLIQRKCKFIHRTRGFFGRNEQEEKRERKVVLRTLHKLHRELLLLTAVRLKLLIYRGVVYEGWADCGVLCRSEKKEERVFFEFFCVSHISTRSSCLSSSSLCLPSFFCYIW